MVTYVAITTLPMNLESQERPPVTFIFWDSYDIPKKLRNAKMQM